MSDGQSEACLDQEEFRAQVVMDDEAIAAIKKLMGQGVQRGCIVSVPIDENPYTSRSRHFEVRYLGEGGSLRHVLNVTDPERCRWIDVRIQGKTIGVIANGQFHASTAGQMAEADADSQPHG